MNPTVSVRRTSLPFGSESLRVVGSSVAKSLSSARTPAPTSAFNTVLFPAFVYPTKETTGIGAAARRSLYAALCVDTLSSLRFSITIRSRSRRLSISICFSPMPLTCPPPPAPPPACLSKCVHILLRRGSWYSSCAISTWSCPSAVLARCEKMSKMSIVRSQTWTLSSRIFARFRFCRGVSSSSKTTVSTTRGFGFGCGCSGIGAGGRGDGGADASSSSSSETSSH
mmetsp:Transcript_6757/g.24935  ORF Transcript_6757/g.24935 Transcript_6757/m.24935 type:complete len:226 (-) Transcript_6757:558-1235(-)